MAEALISAIIQNIATITTEEANQRVKLVKGVEKQVEKMKRHLQAIEVVMEDAEEKQITDQRIKLWRNWLHDVAYDIEDVLDEWNTALLKLKIDGDGKSTSHLEAKVCSLVNSCFHPGHVARRHDIASKIIKICESLDEIARQKDMYGLLMIPAKEMSRRVESSSFGVDLSKLHGRSKIKEDIIDNLFAEEGSCDKIRAVSIVGMGGVGKTALAQLVYHDTLVEQHFKRIWVCVSDIFDEKNVAKAIITGLDEESNYDEMCTLSTVPMEELLKRICASIKGLKFFLVLDDVWTDNRQEWERLLEIFRNGAPGSRILVTTRKDTVTDMMQSSRVFRLDRLSDDDCWMVFSQFAFSGRNEDECKELEDVGRKISDRCKGLPLAAKSLGSLLQNKSRRADWENILDSKLWRLYMAQRDVFAPLLLSYFDLPQPVRQCFKYCAIFPKDHEYWGPGVIFEWKLQGFLSDVDGGIRDWQLKGQEYLKLLAARSFFQDYKMGADGLLLKCKMHDLVHDFARSLMRENESMVVEVNSGSNSVLDLTASKPRYLTVFPTEENCFLTSISGVEELRNFGTKGSAVSGEALRVIFNQAKRLRLVDVKFTRLNSFPKEIGKLIHLRRLNLRGNIKIKRLPESVCDLYNLQYLNLIGCTSLEEIPDTIQKLINLMFLYMFDCSAILHYPKSIGKLKNLKQLSGIKVVTDRNDRKKLSLRDLEKLNQLTDLGMDLTTNTIIDAEEVRRARFDAKAELKNFAVYCPKRHWSLNQEDVARVFNLPAGVLKFCYTSM